MTTTDLERRKPSPRPRRAPTTRRPPTLPTEAAGGRRINIVIDGELVEAIETGDPGATLAIRVSLAAIGVCGLDVAALLAVYYLHASTAAATAAYAGAIVALAAAVAAWAVDYNNRRGGTR